MTSITRTAMTSFLMVVISGCATYNFPSPLYETDVVRILSNVKRIHPREKLYRQYVSDRLYMQFERIGPKNVIYGWMTCTDCNWTRRKMSAIYNGNYLYIIYGHHESLFLSRPRAKPMIADVPWYWNVIDKYQVEGRNLIKLSQYRECQKDSPAIKEWTNRPYVPNVGEMDCRISRSGNYNVIYVATIDDTLVGRRDSMVGSESDTVKERLKALEKLYREGTINESEYNEKRRDILDDL